MLLKINEIKFINRITKKILTIYKDGVIDYPDELNSTIELLAFENKCNIKDIIYICN